MKDIDLEASHARGVAWVHPVTGELRVESLRGDTLLVPMRLERHGEMVVLRLPIDWVPPGRGIDDATWVAAMPEHAELVARRYWRERRSQSRPRGDTADVRDVEP